MISIFHNILSLKIVDWPHLIFIDGKEVGHIPNVKVKTRQKISDLFMLLYFFKTKNNNDVDIYNQFLHKKNF